MSGTLSKNPVKTRVGWLVLTHCPSRSRIEISLSRKSPCRASPIGLAHSYYVIYKKRNYRILILRLFDNAWLPKCTVSITWLSTDPSQSTNRNQGVEGPRRRRRRHFCQNESDVHLVFYVKPLFEFRFCHFVYFSTWILNYPSCYFVIQLRHMTLRLQCTKNIYFINNIDSILSTKCVIDTCISIIYNEITK